MILIIPSASMPELVIIRGLPGSGKTTYARKHYPDHEYYDADSFFMINGKYRFNPDQLENAHADCLKRVKAAIKRRVDIVVCNVFRTIDSIRPYVEAMGKRKGYKLQVIRLITQYVSTHTSLKVIERMARQGFEPFEGEVIVKPNPNSTRHITRNIFAKTFTGDLSDAELANFIPVSAQRVLERKYRDMLPKQVKYLSELDIFNKWLVCLLNAYLPPLRYEWSDMMLYPMSGHNYFSIYNTRLHLKQDEYNNPAVTITLAALNNELMNVIDIPYLQTALRLADKLFPRRYMFCSDVTGRTPLSKQQYSWLLTFKKSYPTPQTPMLLRKAFFTHMMQHFDRMSIDHVMRICDMMRIDDFQTAFFGYLVKDSRLKQKV